MERKIEKVFGPHTLHLSSWGWFTRAFLLFLPSHVYESPDGIVVYKKWGNALYILGVSRRIRTWDRVGDN